MKCPRCGTVMQDGLCPECGFPVLWKRQNGKRITLRKYKRAIRKV